MEAVTLSPIEPARAAALLVAARLHELDPAGIWNPDELAALCERAVCVEAITAAGARGVYVLEVQNGVAWIAAAAGAGPGELARIGLGAVEAHAAGLDAVAFTTSRRGMVRQAARCGYEVTGFVLRKRLKKWT